MNRKKHLALLFVIFHVTLSIVVFILSMMTALEAFRSANTGVLWLATIEALLAIFLLVPKTVQYAAGGLMIIFAIASFLHVAQGKFPGALIIYAAGAAFIGMHGAAFPKHSGNERSKNA